MAPVAPNQQLEPLRTRDGTVLRMFSCVNMGTWGDTLYNAFREVVAADAVSSNRGTATNFVVATFEATIPDGLSATYETAAVSTDWRTAVMEQFPPMTVGMTYIAETFWARTGRPRVLLDVVDSRGACRGSWLWAAVLVPPAKVTLPLSKLLPFLEGK